MSYPGIEKAALLIALDNGGIHRERSERKWRRDFGQWIERQPNEMLLPIDGWLSSLSDADLETVCCGEATEVDALLVSAPVFTDQLLNQYFDEVC